LKGDWHMRRRNTFQLAWLENGHACLSYPCFHDRLHSMRVAETETGKHTNWECEWSWRCGKSSSAVYTDCCHVELVPVSCTEGVLQGDVGSRWPVSWHPVAEASFCEVSSYVVPLFQQKEHRTAKYGWFFGLRAPLDYHSTASPSFRYREIRRHWRKTCIPRGERL
jgi:hypothetical protein